MAELALRRRTAGNKRRRLRWGGAFGRFAVLFTVAAAAILLAEAVMQFVVADRFTITEVRVQSDLPLSRDELLQVAGLSGRLNYLDLDVQGVEQRVASLPQVRSVRVEKSFPDRVMLTVEARRPLVVALAQTEGTTRPLVIDSEGVVFEHSAALVNWDLPVISGLRFEGARLGTRLPDRLHTLLASLGRLRERSPNLLAQFSEFRVSAVGSSAVEVLAYPMAYRTPVRLDDHITEDLLKYAIMVLDLMKDDASFGADVAELDFRSGRAVLRSMRE